LGLFFYQHSFIGAMHLGINQLTQKPEVDTLNQTTRSALHSLISNQGVLQTRCNALLVNG